MTLLIWLLIALAAALAWATWALHGKHPGHLWLGCYAPVFLIGWLTALGDWLDSDDGLPKADPLTHAKSRIGGPQDAAAPPKEALVPPPDQAAYPAPLPPPPPAPPNGSTPPPVTQDGPESSFGGAQSDLLHGIETLVRRASAGDIRDVRRTVKVLTVALDALGHGIGHLSRRLAEPDKHYGAEIWEPLSAGAAQARSGALHLGYSDAMLTSLLRSTVGEIADSPRQAPHHSQLNGPV